MKKISIMIPVYNGSEYLEALYDCLHNQTYKNFEAIFVDDFSTDNTYDILKEFELQDNRFKVVQVEKKGGCAVKTLVQGLKYITGDYFYYVSHDDFFAYDLFEKCIKKAEETGAEIVIPDMILYYEGEESKKHGVYPLNGDYNQILTGKEAFLLSLDWQIHGNSLRSLDLFRYKEFTADYYNSDELYFREMLTWTDKVAFCNSTFYYRQDNKNAITKVKHYFHVDILTTDLLLLQTMILQKYKLSTCLKRLLVLTRKWLGFIKGYGFEKYPKEQKKYVINSLKNSGLKLLKLWFKVWIR